MNRFHVHLNVADLPASIRFYNELFGTAPSVTKHDYAKWMLAGRSATLRCTWKRFIDRVSLCSTSR